MAIGGKTTVKMSPELRSGMQESIITSTRNLADMVVVEMKKLAPYANPAQYPDGYPGNPGTLMRSIKRVGSGNSTTIESDCGYAILRNNHNRLNPQTKNYVERSCTNIANGKTSQWWRASDKLSMY